MLRASINYVDKQGEVGLTKCQRYYITLRVENLSTERGQNPVINDFNVVYAFPIIDMHGHKVEE